MSAQSTMQGASPATPRRASIDVFRGMVMFLMLAEFMHLSQLSDAFPDSTILGWLQFHTTHVPWAGCSLHDLIQPAFTFLVGVSMPFSIAARMRRQTSRRKLWLHAFWRSILLIVIGIILRSLDRDRTYYTFEDTLTQIGLGYFVVFAIAMCPRPVHYVAAAVVIVGYWMVFAVDSPPPADFDYAAVGVPDDWPHHREGFQSRWNKNSNVAWRVDRWFLNLFPRDTPFLFNGGGYSTLSFVPTAATMILGLIAGVWMRQREGRDRLIRLCLAALIAVVLGIAADRMGICPLVKRIWTPSFTLYSGGLCMAWLAGLVWICDERGWASWGTPFLIIGANSILIYVMAWTIAEPIRSMIKRHLVPAPWLNDFPEATTVLTGAGTLAILFAMLRWMYQRRAFVKI